MPSSLAKARRKMAKASALQIEIQPKTVLPIFNRIWKFAKLKNAETGERHENDFLKSKSKYISTLTCTMDLMVGWSGSLTALER